MKPEALSKEAEHCRKMAKATVNLEEGTFLCAVARAFDALAAERITALNDCSGPN